LTNACPVDWFVISIPILLPLFPARGGQVLQIGALLTLIMPAFDVFITLDSNLEHQQNLEAVDLCIITLHAVNSRYETLQPLIPDILKVVGDAKPGVNVHLGG
jgi:hypothetical protein